jgi:hypothetical protein
MNKLSKMLATLATVSALCSPAAAQISGELTVATDNFSAFRALASVDYTTTVAPKFTIKVGADFEYFFTSPSVASAFVRGIYELNDNIGFGVRAQIGVSDIGASNAIGYVLRGFVYYKTDLVSQSDTIVTLYAQAAAQFNGGFGGDLLLAIDAGYNISSNLTLFAGLEGVVFFPIAFQATGYLELDFFLMDSMLVLGAGVSAGFNGTAFGLVDDGIYGFVRYRFNEEFSLRLLGGTTNFNGFTLKLSALFNR